MVEGAAAQRRDIAKTESAPTPAALERLSLRALEFLSREKVAQLATGAEIERIISAYL